MIERSPYNPKHIDGKPECIAHRDSLHGSALRPPESMQWRITDQDRSILDKLAAVSREDPDHAHLREIVTRSNRLQRKHAVIPS